jgi:hypothetical protein
VSVIKPTVGRVVWFYPSKHDGIAHEKGKPLAAIVARVWGDRMVNLSVIDHDGNTHARTSVPLKQEGDDDFKVGELYCEWMPYQKGQAAKAEAAEKALAAKG